VRRRGGEEQRRVGRRRRGEEGEGSGKEGGEGGGKRNQGDLPLGLARGLWILKGAKEDHLPPFLARKAYGPNTMAARPSFGGAGAGPGFRLSLTVLAGFL